MGDFGEVERRILSFMVVGSKFNMNEEEYRIEVAGKPTCAKGESKTDIYILAKGKNDNKEIKISYKKENADFIENKMSAERAEQLFGGEWKVIIETSTREINSKFEERMLIYKNKFKKTGKGSITLGWKFELLNKSGGDLSGKMMLSREQVIDVYAGTNLSDDKRHASVCGNAIKNCGVANYILMDENVNSLQEVINKMCLVEDYVDLHPEIYFACKALNYRTFEQKWDGDRPLSVQVNWNVEDQKLIPEVIYNKPLVVKGNECAERLLKYMNQLNIKNTDDIDDTNVGTDRII